MADEQPLPRPPLSAPPIASVDPWGHELGEDSEHLLDASGHLPHSPPAEKANVLSIEPVIPLRERLRRKRR